MTATFSIIIPTHNSEGFIEDCLNSIARQKISCSDIEVILVDDFSRDNTCSIALNFKKLIPNFTIIKLQKNGGPGVARNEGIRTASNEWIIFLDSDDELAQNSISSLQKYIHEKNMQSLDVIGYDWIASNKSEKNLNSSPRIGRRDSTYFVDKDTIVDAYLSHRMDGSVIYSAIKKSILIDHAIRFHSGLHEDVDFIFNVYFKARSISFFNCAFYIKRNHKNSIINSISEAHIEGYLRAWKTIHKIIIGAEITQDLAARYISTYHYGTIGAIATRVREIVRHKALDGNPSALFSVLYDYCQGLKNNVEFIATVNDCKTLYGNVCNSFYKIMGNSELSESDKAKMIYSEVGNLDGKSLSCTDLQHSVFLRHDEVRTCCKRFFVDGEMRGDVKLFDFTNDSNESLNSKKILKAKRELHQKINSGISNPCDGCSFLEFKKWDSLNKLDIQYLSLEYHSVCNLKCSYCSEEYYGGEKPKYDIEESISTLVKDDALTNCALIVWGGGEPILGKGFDNISSMMAKKLPHAQQRVLSNSVKRSSAIDKLLLDNQGQLITSIDAGKPDTFEKIRGKNHLQRVCKNLKSYSEINNTRVTIKYIFTEDNDSQDEVRAFVALMREYALQNCAYQISGDFKKEHISLGSAMSMVLMFGLLKQLGCQSIYFDELLWHRLGDVFALNSPDYINKLHALTGFKFIASSKKYPNVIVWGAGQQAKYLVSKSDFFKQTEIAYFVDATPTKIGSKYLGKDVKSPSMLQQSTLPIVIAAVQGYALIVEQFKELGISQDRLVSELII